MTRLASLAASAVLVCFVIFPSASSISAWLSPTCKSQDYNGTGPFKEADEDVRAFMSVHPELFEGREVKKTVLLPLGDSGPAQQPLARAGLTTMALSGGIQIAGVNLHSTADKAGFEQGFVVTGIETPAQRPAQEWMLLPPLAVLGGVVLLQRQRLAPTTKLAPA